MSDITLSAAVRSNLLSLQNTASLLDTTQTRLATGNKVNSALDNPTNYFTASSLNARASDLGNLLDGVSNAIQTIQAANDGITSITKLVSSAQATANQAQQLSETVEDQPAVAAAAGTVTASATTLATADGTFVVNGKTINVVGHVDAAAGSVTSSAASNASANGTLTINGTGYTVASGDDATAIAATINATATDVVASVGTGTDAGKLIITGKTVTDGVNITGTVPAGVGLTTGNHAAVAAVAGDDAASLVTKINGTAGIGLVASNSGGKLVLTADTVGGDVNVTTTTTGIGIATGNNAHTAAAAATTKVNPARAAFISQYNGLLDQIDQLTADAGYNGNNLLAGTSSQLKVLFNENGSSSLTVSGKDTTAAGLGLAKLAATDFDTNTSITGILATLKTATDTLRSDASSFGSNLSIVQTRQDFTKNLINTLQTGASNLTLADSNEEAANLLALQTRQSLSTKALSLASQSDQNVLRLLQ